MELLFLAEYEIFIKEIDQNSLRILYLKASYFFINVATLHL